MNTKTNTYHIEVQGLSVEVIRKDIKNFYIGVHPPNGRIRVSAPLRLDDDAIRMAIISRLGWIRRQQAAFEQQDRQSQREFVTGESHYFQGKRYRLDVIEQDCPPKVWLPNNTKIAISVRPGSDRDTRAAVLHRWYRQHLRAQLPPLLEKWEPKLGVSVNEVRIKKMKTLWGSCNIEAKRIWLNLELAKKSNSCLVYVLVHEMVHLLERNHNDHFHALMDKFLPQWRTYRDELNRAPLAHEDWQY
ncbi:M48 family metallopeptidase [Candidatus Poribacteria bacterium]|nr:M48 family metallopeptidase [Candidatus Poribacteria bacterium]MYH83320.1 M48 family metallopeptidase [Candidatus Poribacteria bacterium]MYK93087.1 M48 family metallopeptidase [Candidatus Poribacteria bacterium]